MEEDIRKCEEFINLSFLYGKLSFTKTQLYEYQTAMSTLLTRYKLYEQKLMFALTPTTHELALETQRNFKKIIAENINEDTYTIKRELKKYWNNMDTYWKEV